MFIIVAALVVAGQIIAGGPVKDAEFTTKAACEVARSTAEHKIMKDVLESANQVKKEHPDQAASVDKSLENVEVKTICVDSDLHELK